MDQLAKLRAPSADGTAAPGAESSDAVLAAALAAGAKRTRGTVDASGAGGSPAADLEASQSLQAQLNLVGSVSGRGSRATRSKHSSKTGGKKMDEREKYGALWSLPPWLPNTCTLCGAHVVCTARLAVDHVHRQRRWRDWLQRAKDTLAARPHPAIAVLCALRDEGLALPLLNVYGAGGGGGACMAIRTPAVLLCCRAAVHHPPTR